MSQQLDEKKYVIMPLIDCLRQYNPSIGSYDRSIINLDFNYSVKLSNGKMDILEELVTDYEKGPTNISEERLKAAASTFISDSPLKIKQPIPQPKQITKPKQSYSYIWIIIVGIIIIMAAVVFIINQNSSHKRNENFQFSQPQREKTPEELRQELVLKEQQNPKEYLTHQGTWRENLIGQKVLEGTISNSATLANFKDIVLEVTWLTKTETELKTEYYSIYEYIGANKSVKYKIKVNAPSQTGGVRIGIDSATPVE